MAKQYLTTASLEKVHPTDIFSLAATPSHIFSASGSSSLKVHSTASSDFPIAQTLEGAHKLGCHHIAASREGNRVVSVGFGSEVKVWQCKDEEWREEGSLVDGIKAGELWSIALSSNGQYLASTTHDGRINVWDLATEDWAKIQGYETKGSFGLCIDMSADGTMTATGHVSGSVYVFTNSTGRMLHSLPSLHAPVRTARFSPHGSLIAAAGDARIVALFDAKSGDQIANLTGHSSWIFSLDWSTTGEWLASAGWDGVARIWSTERKQCVSVLRDAAGVGETGSCVWSIAFLPKADSRKGEAFAAAGAAGGITFYREAAGS